MNFSMISYSLDFKDFTRHLIQVKMTFTATSDAPMLWLPSWIPGSYLMREFARNITKVNAFINEKPTDCTKTSKNQWLLASVKSDEVVTLEYEVYAFDLSVRSAYVDQTRLYGNFTSIALAISKQEQDDIEVTLKIPESFFLQNNNATIACTLPTENRHHQYILSAQNYYDLIDHPFEVALQDRFAFTITNPRTNISLPHKFAISGKHQTDIARLQTDLTKICQTYVDWLGDAPFEKYQFMTMATGSDYGGLEHHNSTSLITPRDDLPTIAETAEPSKNYRNFLGLCSHEYFHAWWVKFIRPDVFLAPDLTKEAYTPLLWVFEGFTSYIDDLMLHRSGVISAESYLKQLNSQITRYYATLGRKLQTVAESSFDAWIKLYRADENTGNAGISYYNKGALVALCLDLTLRKYKTSLHKVIAQIYQQAKPENLGGNNKRGVDDHYLNELFSGIMGNEDWSLFRTNYIDGCVELPIYELLEQNGIRLKDNTNALPFGLVTTKKENGLLVQKAMRDGTASVAGISAKDTIIAIDHLQATDKLLAYASKHMKSVDIHFFRRDELHCVSVTAEAYQLKKYQLGIDNIDKAKQWLDF